MGTLACAARARAAGERAVAQLRVHPARTRELVNGCWFDAGVRRRVLRRLLSRAPVGATALVWRLSERAARLAGEAAFWGGVRQAATRPEWQRLTRSSYVVLYYHRLAGELKPGQERLDVPPELFSRQLRLLRLLRFRPLSPEQLIAFHRGSLATLPRRGYVVTADDGFLDCVAPLLRNAGIRPQLFVPTAEERRRRCRLSRSPSCAASRARRS